MSTIVSFWSYIDKAESYAMFTFERIFIIVHLCLLLSLYVYSASKKRESYIITPQAVDSTGAAINMDGHERLKQKMAKLHYKINLEGKQYLLDLQLNKNLHTDAARTESHITGGIPRLLSKRKNPRQCHYIGNVRGYPKSKVALTICDGLMGYILIKDKIYMIEPLRNISSVTDDGHPHLMYTEDKNGRRMATCSNRGHKNKFARPKRKTRKPLHHKHTEKQLFERQGHLKQMYMEVTLILDRTLLDFHASIDVDAYMVTIMNIANAAMSDGSFGAPIELVLVRIVKLEQEDDEMNIAVTPDSEKVLEIFEAWQMRFNPTSDQHPDHHDMAILVTRVDICLPGHPDNCGLVGLTQLGTLCDPLQSAMLAEDDGLTLGFTIAHELGHTMGMLHDSEDESGCEPYPFGDGYQVLMADDINPKMRGWSNCSREYLWAWLDTGQDFCLYDQPQSERFKLSNTLPGASYGLHHQCRFYLGDEFTDCPDEGIECSNMKCMIHPGNCVHTESPLADGTECYPHHWCFRGHCINEGMMPQSQDGQWSDWGPWSACSRHCGVGVTKSIRHCNNPPPMEGGRHCSGQRVRHNLCNTASCPYGTPSFRDVQCTEFDTVPYFITNKTHTWKSVATTAENPCELLCENEAKQRSVLKSQVTDGTPCFLGENHICVSGVCQNVPCDMVVGSAAVEDACGVCHGSGDSCSLESSEVHFTIKATYQTVVVVPQGVIFATIEEMFPTKSDFLIRVEGETVLTGRKFGVTMLGATKIWMGQIRHQQEIIKIRGPITKDLNVMIAARDEVTVKYTLGTRVVQNKPTYKWDYIDWGECSVPCGPGTQIQVAKCVEAVTGLVEDKYCAHDEKPPPLSRLCEMRACEPRWQIGEWSGCDCECADDEDDSMEEERAVDCVRRIGDEEEIIVADALCESPKPIGVRKCVCPPRDNQHKPKEHHPKTRGDRNKFVRYTQLEKRGKRKHHDGVLSRSHIQNIHAIEEIRGALFVDYHNLDKLHFAVEVDDDVRKHKIKGLPKPKANDNLVHIKGRQAVKFLQSLQARSHRNTTNK